jgi:hypothetical protein
MTSRRRIALLALLLFLAPLGPVQAGGRFDIRPAAISGGGGTSSGGSYSLEATIGQPGAGNVGGSRFAIVGGLWPMVSPAVLPACAGDCSGDRQVVVSELIIMVRLSLSGDAPVECEAGDRNEDGRVSVDEMIVAVRSALTSCL